MVSQALSWVVSWTLMLLLGLAVTLALVGCESAERQAATPPLATPQAIPPQPASQDDPATQAEALAQRLEAQYAAAGVSSAESWDPQQIDESFDPFAGAKPLPAQRPATPVAEASPEAAWLNGQPDPKAMSEPVNPAAALDEAAGLPPTVGFSQPAPAEPAPLTRAQLMQRLHDQLALADEPALARAVTAAALSLADPDHELDPTLLESLKPMQREAVERLHTVFLRLQSQAADPEMIDRTALGLGFDRKSLETLLADAFGQAPLTISHADLCRSVAGYGVYEPMGSHNFLSGQVNRAIIYVEVEDFAAAPVGDDQHEVKLVQELVLYKESDGLAVWRHEPTQIVDRSRNRRRDFYIVQMISLPARLSEGRYRLKIRVNDEHGQSVDETTLKLQVVADAGLLQDSAMP